MRGTAVLKKNKNMVTRVIDQETVLLPVFRSSEELDCIYSLNKSASRVWQLIDGKRTAEEIKKQILEEFASTKEEAGKNLEKLFKDLEKIKAIAKK